MSLQEPNEPDHPSPRAVKCGRFVFCLVGAVFLAVAGIYTYMNPHKQVYLTAGVLLAGFVLVWLGLALPPRYVAVLGFNLPWFLPHG
jgi:hypothetical protein